MIRVLKPLHQRLRGHFGRKSELRTHFEVLPQGLGEGHSLLRSFSRFGEHRLEAPAGLVDLVLDRRLVVGALAVRVDEHALDHLVDLLGEEVSGGPEHAARHLAEGVAGEGLAIGNVRACLLHEGPLLFEQALLVGGDKQSRVGLDHGHEALKVGQVDLKKSITLLYYEYHFQLKSVPLESR